MMQELVQQRADFDCALACLAMASGRKYEEIFDDAFCWRIDQATTCTGDDLVEAYRRAGFEKDKNMRSIYVGWNVNPSLLRTMIWGRRALIQVPSLNYDGSEHFVFWNGKEVLDPSRKQTYKYLQNIFATYITVFDEMGDALDISRSTVVEECLQAADKARKQLADRYQSNINNDTVDMDGNMDWARLEGAVRAVDAIRAIQH